MHSNVTVKNVSWPHFSWPILYKSVTYGNIFIFCSFSVHTINETKQ